MKTDKKLLQFRKKNANLKLTHPSSRCTKKEKILQIDLKIKHGVLNLSPVTKKDEEFNTRVQENYNR